jgi:hypothetical protein
MLLIVTEYPSRDDDGLFSKAQYNILRQMFGQVGLPLNNTEKTSVFSQPARDILDFAGPKDTALPGFPAVGQGKYVSAAYAGDLEKLARTIERVKPNLILGFGPAAAWALLRNKSVKGIRGAPTTSVYGPKCLITYHPASVLRDYGLRPIVISDLAKAANEQTFPEVIRPSREIWLSPTFADLLDFEARFIEPSSKLSIDIETAQRQITCIGFAPTPDRALVVPITCRAQRSGNYWDLGTEVRVWNWIRKQCARKISIIGQNFLYDANFLWTIYGITCPNMAEDTMLLHHALQPEMEKGLGFLATLYTNEPPWKMMRKNETVKRED